MMMINKWQFHYFEEKKDEGESKWKKGIGFSHELEGKEKQRREKMKRVVVECWVMEKKKVKDKEVGELAC